MSSNPRHDACLGFFIVWEIGESFEVVIGSFGDMLGGSLYDII